MQFKVPQNVQREDKIVGPLTLKQMIICAIGGTIGYAIFTALAKFYLWITWLPPVAIVTIITIAFAFVRPLDLSFTKWVLRWIEFSLLPRKRIWIKSSAEIIKDLEPESMKRKISKKEDQINKITEKQEKLSKFLEDEKNKKKL
ncbi:PrgI family protein [Patescibacteria group bacterium]|nr:PrgI family protein [Patescibacteria group bacterium]MBU1953785.1 PrgI family protein [Patescibacteria group bacterium]